MPLLGTAAEAAEILEILRQDKEESNKRKEETALAEMEQTRLRMEEARKSGRWSRTGSIMQALGIVGDKRKQAEAALVSSRRPHPLALAGEDVRGRILRKNAFDELGQQKPSVSSTLTKKSRRSVHPRREKR